MCMEEPLEHIADEDNNRNGQPFPPNDIADVLHIDVHRRESDGVNNGDV